MRIGVLGTGMVGKTIGARLVGLGHEVVLGSRTPDNPSASAWARQVGDGADRGTFADAARFGELLFNCTAGTGSLAAVGSADEGDLVGKVLIDVANPLDFSQGFPPSLSVVNTDSLGEQIQRAHPALRVVKALNTMNCQIMVDPGRLGATHHVFLSGDDADAKGTVVRLLQEFGWPASCIIDLGDITTARGPEMFLPLWLRLYGVLATGEFNIAVVR
ncbi:MAG TPA: NAD(P)-binding domain-containing protein [Egibacteraceae bacterium]|nr:NAD(P)-binding domain-containing protein [Actinomycetota bacterium]HWB71327.1 NAD(P)-binding domain-containing protein [Egibacteraceae bacterium]